MSGIDRRKSDDRRGSRRYPVSLDIEWEIHSDRRTGTLSDISREGCFILSGVEVSDGELVKVLIPLSDGMKVEFLGQVANFVFEIGFAVHFISLSDAQKEVLESFVQLHAEAPPA